MIQIDLTTWSRVRHGDGSVVLTAPLQHPGFAANRHATIRFRHDVRPIATLDAVCESLKADMRIDRCDATDRFVTRGGEYGAFRHLRVHVGDEALSWAVGLIVGDDRMTIVDGLASSPNIAALVRDVLESSISASAYDRIRMVPYRPPAGWFGVQRSLATTWLAPAAPAMIVACDAVPRGPAERLHALLWPLEVPESAKRTAFEGGPAPGDVATWSIDGRISSVVHLASERWSVRVALHAGADQHLVVLRDLVRSIELPVLPMTDARPNLDLDWMAT